MGISGEEFLGVGKAAGLEISKHAMEGLEKHLGFGLTAGLATAFFKRSRQVKAEEMFLLGYRPSHGRRLGKGVRSWYFLFRVFGQELVAVLGEEGGTFTWVSTFAPVHQTEYLRLVDASAVTAA